MTSYTIPFAEGSINIDLPRGMRATVATSRPRPPLDAPRATAGALVAPLGTPDLGKLAKRDPDLAGDRPRRRRRGLRFARAVRAARLSTLPAIDYDPRSVVLCDVLAVRGQ